MNITIIGAGAMGCLYATLLSGKHRIRLVDAYLPTVEAINRNGVVVTEKDNTKKSFDIPAFESGKADGESDLVIVFVKDTATDSALSSNKNIIGEDTYVLSLQNGMGNDEVIRRYVASEKILLGTTRHNSVVLSPGNIYHSGSGATVIGSSCGDDDVGKRFANELSTSCVEFQFCESVKYLLWEKLFVNMTINPITALLETKISFFDENPYLHELTSSLLKEAVEVAYKDGAEFEYDKVFEMVYRVSAADSSGKASMLQDMEHGRKTEIDYINGSVSRLGRKYGIPTPTHDALIQLIHAKENITKEHL